MSGVTFSKGKVDPKNTGPCPKAGRYTVRKPDGTGAAATKSYPDAGNAADKAGRPGS